MNIFSKPVLKFCTDSLKIVALSYIIHNYVGTIDVIYGSSMNPTLKHHDGIYIDRILTKLFGVKKGDIVVSRSFNNPYKLYCKRVTAVAGEMMVDRNNSPILVPDNHVWLMGDNRGDSYDSRDYGPVPLTHITGRVVFRFYPLKTMEIFDRNHQN